MRRRLLVVVSVLLVAGAVTPAGAVKRKPVKTTAKKAAKKVVAATPPTAPPTAPPTTTPTTPVTVILTLFQPQPAPAGEPCEGRDGYDDIREGASVVVKNDLDRVIGSGSLGKGRRFAEPGGGLSCVLTASIGDVEKSAFYQVSVGRRGSVTFSDQSLVIGVGNLPLKIGRREDILPSAAPAPTAPAAPSPVTTPPPAALGSLQNPVPVGSEVTLTSRFRSVSARVTMLGPASQSGRLNSFTLAPVGSTWTTFRVRMVYASGQDGTASTVTFTPVADGRQLGGEGCIWSSTVAGRPSTVALGLTAEWEACLFFPESVAPSSRLALTTSFDTPTYFLLPPSGPLAVP